MSAPALFRVNTVLIAKDDVSHNFFYNLLFEQWQYTEHALYNHGNKLLDKRQNLRESSIS